MSVIEVTLYRSSIFFNGPNRKNNKAFLENFQIFEIWCLTVFIDPGADWTPISEKDKIEIPVYFP